MKHPRALAAQTLTRVIDHGSSLTAALDQALPHAAVADRALIQELCYGTLRAYFRLDPILTGLMRKPLKSRDGDLRALLLLGLYQLSAMRVPPHAAVAETVDAAQALGKPWARGLVNAVLRNFQRDAGRHLARAESTEPGRWAHPQWLIDALRVAWPADWQTILAANDDRAPMTLRVNRRQQTRDVYLQHLQAAGIDAQPTPFSACGLRLTQAVDVTSLPGFSQGAVSVQDEAAQLAAPLLDVQDGERVLDVCAAPGGKTAHILERAAPSECLALDIDTERLQRVEGTLQRLGLHATLRSGDARDTTAWWDGRPFDRILLDAPCSATGVIRRHPDIKLLRRATDIETLVQLQAEILRAIWPLLRPGGMLLYATCSVLPAENEQQITTFLDEQADAEALPLATAWGRGTGAGRQILPGNDAGMDGFYYACIQKLTAA